MPEARANSFDTHEVVNQSTSLVDYNLFTSNLALSEAVVREGGAWAFAQLSSFGALLGRAETFEAGALANKNPPILKTFDRFGHRIDEVEFHPAYHELSALAVSQGIHSSPWADPKPGAHVVRAAAATMLNEVEAGVGCPTTMTYGCVPAIKRRPDIAEFLLPKVYSRNYDKRFIPLAEKSGALIGMGMTEKQGGSDVRSNSTRATVLDAERGEYTLVGHKWFLSAPMCDAFLVLAQAPAGLSCFYMPRWLPDRTRNRIHIQRLKDKLGNKSNASSEVEFQNAHGWLVGEEGRGVPTIIEMATYTRLDCGLGTLGLMRQALSVAMHHASTRQAFQKNLVDQPLMRNVLADMVLEVEVATALSMRLARAFDHQSDPIEEQFRRVVTPAIKYWNCKRGPILGAEAMEVMGGAGYVEECNMPRLYRELPLNGIWEGSGNVMCLDVLRALSKNPAGVEAVRQEWALAKGGDARLDRYAIALEADLVHALDNVADARRLAERLALCIGAAQLVRFAPKAVSDAFCASRLDRDWGSAFGTLPNGCDFGTIIERGSVDQHCAEAPSLVANR
ncbi:unnamed protein product [Sphagnum balticum]